MLVSVDDALGNTKTPMYMVSGKSATLAFNLIVIAVLVWGGLNTTAELSTRFMSLLEIVIGAIFGVTATQITKG